MMTIAKFLKRYPLSLLTATAVLILCMMPVPEVQVGLSFADKWAHVALFFALSVILGVEYKRACKKTGQRIVLWLPATILLAFAGLTELLQTYATLTRQGDWLDFAANAIGVGVALFLARLCRLR